MQFSKSLVVLVLSAALSAYALPSGDLTARDVMIAREPTQEIKVPIYGHPKDHDRDKHRIPEPHHIKPYEVRDIDYGKPEHKRVKHHDDEHHHKNPYEIRDVEHIPKHKHPEPVRHHHHKEPYEVRDVDVEDKEHRHDKHHQKDRHPKKHHEGRDAEYHKPEHDRKHVHHDHPYKPYEIRDVAVDDHLKPIHEKDHHHDKHDKHDKHDHHNKPF